MKLTFLLFSVACFIYSSSCYQFYSKEWENFKLEHEKNHDPSDDYRRMKIWSRNKEIVEAHNKKFREGKVSYKKTINKFSDMTEIELKNLYKGLKVEEPKGSYEKRVIFKPTEPIAAEKDWRTEGAVTEVKNQGACGSCYSFSVTGAVEGQHFLATKQLVSLSEQQIVDCTRGINFGCDGGFMDKTYGYITSTGGLNTEQSYSYTGDGSQACRFDANNVGATVSGFHFIDNNEDSLLNAVATVGPISVGIYVANSFYSYGGGVYDEPNCNGQINHGVLVVGYGSENGNDYWLVKNSWGNWGDQGYIKMARNKGNQCSIANYATVPTGVGEKVPAKKLKITDHITTVVNYFMKVVVTKSST